MTILTGLLLTLYHSEDVLYGAPPQVRRIFLTNLDF
jgi:hypothetical protein